MTQPHRVVGADFYGRPRLPPFLHALQFHTIITRLPPRPNRFHGQARFFNSEWLRDNSIAERERRPSVLILSYCESSPRFLGHVEPAAVSFRRDEDEVVGMLVDDIGEIRVH